MAEIFIALDSDVSTQNQVWATFSNNTPTCGSGTPTAISAVTRWNQPQYRNAAGKQVMFQLTVTVTTLGTCATNIQAIMPFTPKSNVTFVGSDSADGKAIIGRMTGGSNIMTITKFDGTMTGIANGSVLTLSGFCEAQ